MRHDPKGDAERIVQACELCRLDLLEKCAAHGSMEGSTLMIRDPVILFAGGGNVKVTCRADVVKLHQPPCIPEVIRQGIFVSAAEVRLSWASDDDG